MGENMKKLSPLVLLGIFLLSACASPATPAPTATLIPSATAVPTLSSTATPEASPTATIDPNAPQGYTRFENGIYYLDEITENGNEIISTWDPERKAYYSIIYHGFALDQSKELNDDYPDIGKDQLMMTMYMDRSIIDALTVPTLIHPDNISPFNSPSFTRNFTGRMTEALEREGVIKPGETFSFAGWAKGLYYLPFKNADGDQRLDLKPGSEMETHIRGDYAKLKANMATNGFFETQVRDNYGPANSYMIKIWTDSENNGHVEIAPLLPASQWTEEMFYEMAFIGFGNIFESSDQVHPQSSSLTSGFILNRETFPYFEFGPPQ